MFVLWGPRFSFALGPRNLRTGPGGTASELGTGGRCPSLQWTNSSTECYGSQCTSKKVRDSLAMYDIIDHLVWMARETTALCNFWTNETVTGRHACMRQCGGIRKAAKRLIMKDMVVQHERPRCRSHALVQIEDDGVFLLSTWLQLFTYLILFNSSLKEDKVEYIQHLTLGVKRRQLCIYQSSREKKFSTLPIEPNLLFTYAFYIHYKIGQNEEYLS
jgi:hypothetical protein